MKPMRKNISTKFTHTSQGLKCRLFIGFVSYCLLFYPRRVRALYKTLLVRHSTFLVNDGRDVDGQLWKTCFYKPIEESRSKIRKCNFQISTMNQQPLNSSVYSIPQLEAYINTLTNRLNLFLSDGLLFYQSLIAEVLKMIFQHYFFNTRFFHVLSIKV